MISRRRKTPERDETTARLFLAQSEYSQHRDICPLSGVKRTCILRHGLSANDAVEGAYAAASRWRRMVGSKGEIQRADADVGGMKNASAQIGQTNW